MANATVEKVKLPTVAEYEAVLDERHFDAHFAAAKLVWRLRKLEQLEPERPVDRADLGAAHDFQRSLKARAGLLEGLLDEMTLVVDMLAAPLPEEPLHA